MAQINNGGEFSDDPFAKLVAMKLGSMNNSDLEKKEGIPEDSIDLASGTMGSVSPISKISGKFPGLLNMGEKVSQPLSQEVSEAVASKLGLADKIKPTQSGNNFGKIITPDGALTNGASVFQQGSAPEAAINKRFQMLKKNLNK